MNDKERFIFIDTKEINTLDFDLNKLKNYDLNWVSLYIKEKRT